MKLLSTLRCIESYKHVTQIGTVQLRQCEGKIELFDSERPEPFIKLTPHQCGVEMQEYHSYEEFAFVLLKYIIDNAHNSCE